MRRVNEYNILCIPFSPFMRRKIITVALYMTSVLIFCMKNAITLLQALYVVVLKKISAHLYMMNMGMAMWKTRVLNGISPHVLQIQKYSFQ